MTERWEFTWTTAELCAGLPQVETKAQIAPHTIARSDVEWDEAGNIARGRAYLAREAAAGRVAFEHENGNATLHRLACQLRDFKITEAKAAELIWEVFNPHCRPSWNDPGDPTYVAPIHSAYHGGAKNLEPGRDAVTSAAAAFGNYVEARNTNGDATPHEGGDEYQSLVKLFRGREPDEDENLPDIEFWDAESTIPKMADGATIVFYGPSGHHKTTVILADLLDAVERGARVTVALGEGAHAYRKSRLPAACKQRGLRTKDLRGRFRVCPAVPRLTDPMQVGALIEAYKDFQPNIVVIDTLATASGDVDENDSKFGKLLTSSGPVGRIKRAFNCTVICVHHSGKDLERGSRGHSSIGGNADGMFRITADKEARIVTKLVEKMRDGEDGFSVEYSLTPPGQVPVATKIGRVARHAVADADDLLQEIKAVLVRKGIRGERDAITSGRLSRLMLMLEDPTVSLEGSLLTSEQEQRRRALEKRVQRSVHDVRFAHLVRRSGPHKNSPWLWSLPLADGGAE